MNLPNSSPLVREVNHTYLRRSIVGGAQGFESFNGREPIKIYPRKVDCFKFDDLFLLYAGLRLLGVCFLFPAQIMWLRVIPTLDTAFSHLPLAGNRASESGMWMHSWMLLAPGNVRSGEKEKKRSFYYIIYSLLYYIIYIFFFL